MTYKHISNKNGQFVVLLKIHNLNVLVLRQWESQGKPVLNVSEADTPITDVIMESLLLSKGVGKLLVKEQQK